MGMTESVVFVWRKGGSISFNNSWLFDQLKTYKLNPVPAKLTILTKYSLIINQQTQI